MVRRGWTCYGCANTLIPACQPGRQRRLQRIQHWRPIAAGTQARPPSPAFLGGNMSEKRSVKPHEPGCPVRGKDGVCETAKCDWHSFSAVGGGVPCWDTPHHSTKGAYPHKIPSSNHEGTRCPGFLDAAPGPDCERRKVDRREVPGCVCGKALCRGDCGLPPGTHWLHHADGSPLREQRCREHMHNLYRYIDASINRRSGTNRRNATP